MFSESELSAVRASRGRVPRTSCRPFRRLGHLPTALPVQNSRAPRSPCRGSLPSGVLAFCGLISQVSGNPKAIFPRAGSAPTSTTWTLPPVMTGQGRPVSLLVGHSLGGAAAILAAEKLEGLKALVTIAAPSEADHVIGQLGPSVEEIESEGEARVTLGGRPFMIKRPFLEDLRQARVGAAVSRLRLPYLILHAPGDNEVSVDHATALFLAARHPKSFVSLDDADHFLSRDRDTDFAANVIAGWAGHYLGAAEDETAGQGDGVLVRETPGPGPYQNEVVTGSFRQIIDEPRSLGGSDTGPDPYSMLSAALGGCTRSRCACTPTVRTGPSIISASPSATRVSMRAIARIAAKLTGSTSFRAIFILRAT